MPATNSYREEVRIKTKQDQILMKLMKMVGWPNTKKECPKDIQPYWASRQGISIIDDMLIHG